MWEDSYGFQENVDISNTRSRLGDWGADHSAARFSVTGMGSHIYSDTCGRPVSEALRANPYCPTATIDQLGTFDGAPRQI